MSDFISRQDAIDYFVTNIGVVDEDGYAVGDYDERVKIWTERFSGIPSAEPERIIKIGQRSGKTLESAIDYLRSVGWLQEHDRILTESAEPERKIIYCKDCKFAHLTTKGEIKYCDVWFPETKMYLSADDFCSSAEKRGK